MPDKINTNNLAKTNRNIGNYILKRIRLVQKIQLSHTLRKKCPHACCWDAAALFKMSSNVRSSFANARDH